MKMPNGFQDNPQPKKLLEFLATLISNEFKSQIAPIWIETEKPENGTVLIHFHAPIYNDNDKEKVAETNRQLIEAWQKVNSLFGVASEDAPQIITHGDPIDGLPDKWTVSARISHTYKINTSGS